MDKIDVNDKRCWQCQDYKNCFKFYHAGPEWKPCSRPLHAFAYSDEIVSDLQEENDSKGQILTRIQTVLKRVTESGEVTKERAYAFYVAVKSILSGATNTEKIDERR